MEGNDIQNGGNGTEQQAQGKVCTGDCFGCSYQQAWMCASVHSRRTMRLVEELRNEVATLHENVEELKKELKKKEEMINPLDAPNQEEQPKQEKKKKIAQKQGGADNRPA